jgi:predicted GNAT superfamily acetyltransferase
MGSPTGANVRDLRSDDLAAVLAINAANVPEVGAVDADRLSFLVAESTFSLVVDIGGEVDGEVGGEVVGFCVVLPLGSSYDSVNYRWFAERYDDVVYLDRVAFDERHQRRGLGRLLYRAVEQRASAVGAAAIALEVNVDPPNDASLAFHARQGYIEVGRQDTPYGIVVSMQRKELDAASDTTSVNGGPA